MDITQKKLCEIYADYGNSIIDAPFRCKGLLKDMCNGYEKEINVFVCAVEEGIPAEMLAYSNKGPVELLLTRFINKLIDNRGIDSSLAKWAVESWALTLGVISEEYCTEKKSKKSLEKKKITSSVQSDIEPTISPPYKTRMNKGVIENGVQEKLNIAEVYYKQGIDYGQIGENYKAINAFEKAISIDQNNADFYYALGVAYFKIKCYGQAKEMLKKAISKNPNYIKYPGIVNIMKDNGRQ